MDYKITAFDLKLALLEYFRFNRQWVCIDELRLADVVADTGKDIIEVEIKISKGDLVNKECRKTKHQFYCVGQQYCGLHPNKFYFCVPESLVEFAMEMCLKLNPKYGVIAFNPYVFKRHIQWNNKIPHRECLRMARTGKRLHESYTNHLRAIAMRTSSKIITLMGTQFQQRLEKENTNG